MYRHSAYSLVIESELELPELPATSAERPADLRVEFGTVPESIADPVGGGVLYEAGENELLLRVPDVASFHVSGGDRIIVQPMGASDHEVRVFLLGSAIGAALHQRGVLVLHAAAVLDEGADGPGAVCFAGNSGAGKSTLLGELLRRGRKMVVDDVCAIDLVDGVATVMPGYARTRLWADSAERLDIDTSDLTRTRPSLEKFERQVDDRFHDRPLPLRAVYVLGSHNDDDVRIEEVPGLGSFRTLLHHTYRRRYVEQLQVMRTHFGVATAAAAQARVCHVRRPSGRFALAELADAIEADLVGVGPVDP